MEGTVREQSAILNVLAEGAVGMQETLTPLRTSALMMIELT